MLDAEARNQTSFAKLIVGRAHVNPTLKSQIGHLQGQRLDKQQRPHFRYQQLKANWLEHHFAPSQAFEKTNTDQNSQVGTTRQRIPLNTNTDPPTGAPPPPPQVGTTRPDTCCNSSRKADAPRPPVPQTKTGENAENKREACKNTPLISGRAQTGERGGKYLKSVGGRQTCPSFHGPLCGFHVPCDTACWWAAALNRRFSSLSAGLPRLFAHHPFVE